MPGPRLRPKCVPVGGNVRNTAQPEAIGMFPQCTPNEIDRCGVLVDQKNGCVFVHACLKSLISFRLGAMLAAANQELEVAAASEGLRKRAKETRDVRVPLRCSGIPVTFRASPLMALRTLLCTPGNRF